jgi:hypothetical protein
LLRETAESLVWKLPQGMWIVRSYLYLALARVDRAQMFMLADVDNSGNKFATSGLTTSKASSYTPKKSWYMLSTLTNLLRHTRCVGEIKPVLVSEVGMAARVASFRRDPAATQGAAIAYAAWLGSKTGASTSVTLDISADLALLAASTTDQMTAVLVELSPNSTNGRQSALPIGGGKVIFRVSEMPRLILLGPALEPQPPSGLVPPIDPPVAQACKGLPRGLNCTASPLGGFVVCPGGQTEVCADGDECVQVSPGRITCKPTPTGVCGGKAPGLYCDPSAAKKGWPDAYVECPQVLQMYCPAATPKCTQSDATIKCTATL